jgi:hypothetical protein
MGDNFLKQQIKNFEKSTDLAVDVLEREKLIRRPEVSRRTYKGQPLVGESGRICTPSSPGTARRSP